MRFEYPVVSEMKSSNDLSELLIVYGNEIMDKYDQKAIHFNYIVHTFI